ncbi:MAG: stage III sporulation protein D [Lactobacillales bacterium]|nr:stage III sporulation protein D [Lactobacillales bacterium]
MKKSSVKNLVIYNRVLESANYIIEHNATVRETAKITKVGKTTTHLDLTTRLEEINPKLHKQVEEILENNKVKRHIRGGEATRQKFLSMKNNK